MVFFGKNSKHIEKMESEGHHIHEAPLSMWIPYGILAVLTIGIGVIGLSAEEGIHHLFTDYLEESFGIGVVSAVFFSAVRVSELDHAGASFV